MTVSHFINTIDILQTLLLQTKSDSQEYQFISPLSKRKRTYSETIDSCTPLKKVKQEIPIIISNTQCSDSNEQVSLQIQVTQNIQSDRQLTQQTIVKKTYKKRDSRLQLTNDKTQGRWTKEEHKRFVEAIKIHGKDWRKVEEFIGTRNGAQIRSHAQKYFIRISKEVENEGKEILNSSEEKCQTARGLELFRKIIANYESSTLTKQGDQESSGIDQEHIQEVAAIEQQILTQEVRTNGGKPNQNKNQKKKTCIFTQDQDMKESNLLLAQEPVQNDQQRLMEPEIITIRERFTQIIKKKEELVKKIYAFDQDICMNSKQYINELAEILSEILLIFSWLSRASKCSDSEKNKVNNLIEKVLIFINEIVHIQKIINDIYNQSEIQQEKERAFLNTFTSFKDINQPQNSISVSSVATQNMTYMNPLSQIFGFQNLFTQPPFLFNNKFEQSVSPKIRGVKIIQNNAV